MKSLGPGRALEEPMSGDVGDGLRYLVYHGLPHDSGIHFSGFRKSATITIRLFLTAAH